MEDYQDMIKRLTIPGMIALLAGTARFAFSEKKSLWSFFRGVMLAGFVGFMTGFGLQDSHLSEGVRFAIIGVTSFCADEVAMFLVAAATELRKDPLGYLSKIVDSLRGKKP